MRQVALPCADDHWRASVLLACPLARSSASRAALATRSCSEIRRTGIHPSYALMVRFMVAPQARNTSTRNEVSASINCRMILTRGFKDWTCLNRNLPASDVGMHLNSRLMKSKSFKARMPSYLCHGNSSSQSDQAAASNLTVASPDLPFQTDPLPTAGDQWFIVIQNDKPASLCKSLRADV